MNWTKWIPWCSTEEQDKDSKTATRVVEGQGPARVIESEEEYSEEPDYGFTD